MSNNMSITVEVRGGKQKAQKSWKKKVMKHSQS